MIRSREARSRVTRSRVARSPVARSRATVHLDLLFYPTKGVPLTFT